MGRVFLGMSAGRRPVAVKVIRRDLAADPEFRERFRREVAAARKVNGMFTAMVVDADVDAAEPWLATAYVAGPSLAEAVHEFGPLPASSVLALAAGLAESLAAIHAADVVHRDLKPSNVLLAEDGPRVIDFGISRAAEATSVTRAGFVVGSPGFMSPEQAEGSVVGPPSDMFSLGAILAFAATGESPFGAGSTAALVYRVVHAPARLEGTPEEIRPLIERCLAKEPGERPTASEFLTETAAVHPMTGWLPGSITGAFRVGPAVAELRTPGAVQPAAPAVAEAAVAEAAVAAGVAEAAAEAAVKPTVQDARTVTGQAVTPVDGVKREGTTVTPPVEAATPEPRPVAEPLTGLVAAAPVAGATPVPGETPAARATPVPGELIPGLASSSAPVPMPGEDLRPQRPARVRRPPREAKPPRPAKPPREAKPPRTAKPPRAAKPPREAKPTRPPGSPLKRLPPRARRPLMISAAAVILIAAVATALAETSGPGHKPSVTGQPVAVSITTAAGDSTSSAVPSATARASATAKASAKATRKATGKATKKSSPDNQATTPDAPTTTPAAIPSTTPASTAPAPTPTHSRKPAPAPTHSHTTAPPAPTTFGFTVSGASEDSCGGLSGLSSSAGSAVSFTFTDNSSTSVSIYEVGSGGSLSYQASIDDGGEYQVSTAVGDYWMIGNSSGSCLGVFGVDGSGSVTVN
jgi:eukaryotic-like serine/threonine-protein kinase